MLKLEEDAVILGSSNTTGGSHGEEAEYPLLVMAEVWRWFGNERGVPGCPRIGNVSRLMHSPLLFAWHQTNITIIADSGGTLDGNGGPWWACERNQTLAPCDCHGRPHNIFFSNVSGVTIKGLTAKNSPEWGVHLGWCDDVHVKGLKGVSPPPNKLESNADGIDIDACQRVLIEDSHFSVNDDAVCLKSGVDWFGRKYGRPTRDVLVRNITIENGEGPAIGSEQAGGVINATFEDIRIGTVQDGPTIKSCRGRGGLVENITFRRITGTGVATMPPPIGAGQPWPQLWLRMVYPCPNPSVVRNASATPIFRNIVYEDVVFERGGLQMSIQGLPESPVHNVTFLNVSFVDTVGAPPPWGTQVWGACENVVGGTCDSNTPEGSCPPCFRRV